MKTTPSQQIFPKVLSKILLGIPVDPILNFLERADRELSKNVYFYPLWFIVFELWLFALRHVATPQNRLSPPINENKILCTMNTQSCRINRGNGVPFSSHPLTGNVQTARLTHRKYKSVERKFIRRALFVSVIDRIVNFEMSHYNFLKNIEISAIF